MGRRLELQSLLETLLGNDGTVYYQPKPKLQLVYPCIIYGQDQAKNGYADNIPYVHTKRWQITVIHTDPDSDIPDKIAALPMSTFQRAFGNDNLYHHIYSVYF